MYFAVVKITFESENGAPAPDRKDMSALIEKLRARFRITVMAYSNGQEDGETAIAYTSLAMSEESLGKQLDAISAFCEETGIGRIGDEAVLMDHIDSIGEDSEE
ncbi:MAG: hypothetical protein WCO71_07560 [Pseudomonadota bacterium]